LRSRCCVVDERSAKGEGARLNVEIRKQVVRQKKRGRRSWACLLGHSSMSMGIRIWVKQVVNVNVQRLSGTLKVVEGGGDGKW
jgi:hypothetical protein